LTQSTNFLADQFSSLRKKNVLEPISGSAFLRLHHTTIGVV